jgi:hypothetical protein
VLVGNEWMMGHASNTKALITRCADLTAELNAVV